MFVPSLAPEFDPAKRSAARLRIHHLTRYRFSAPVAFGEWRLLVRPIDNHAIRVLDAGLTVTPPGRTLWTSDAYSNSICHFYPQGEGTILEVISDLVIDRFPAPLALDEWTPPLLPPCAWAPPVTYSFDEATALCAFIRPAEPDSAAHAAWASSLRNEPYESALALLQRLNTAIKTTLAYGARDEYGTLKPAETLARGSGTCRDFAWLMIETARRWGFAARFVTGYVYPGQQTSGAGATHAWCEVFLPELGWTEFDPTNGLVESPDLIRVAATRAPHEASPVSGVVLGTATSTLEVDVSVELA